MIMSKLKQKKKYLALILVRKNSRRLKNKNVKILGKKPLILITLDNLIRISYLFENIVVSSDSKIVEKYAKQRKVIFIKRPTNLAYSGTSSENSAMHSIKRYEKEFSKIDYIILFQVTSPFRKNSTIKKIINLSKKYPNDQIVTVSDRIVKKPNGVMYLTPKDTLFKKKNFSYKNFRPYLIKSKKESLDIDTYDDFKIAKKMIKA
jgi:CMP-N-acetylneuraminic acid synthetase